MSSTHFPWARADKMDRRHPRALTIEAGLGHSDRAPLPVIKNESKSLVGQDAVGTLGDEFAMPRLPPCTQFPNCYLYLDVP